MTKPKTLQELFSDPARWTRGAIARKPSREVCSDDDSDSVSCSVRDPGACRWCMLGGVRLVYPPEKRQVIERRLAGTIAELWESQTRIVRSQTDSTFEVVMWWNDYVASAADVQKLVREAGV